LKNGLNQGASVALEGLDCAICRATKRAEGEERVVLSVPELAFAPFGDRDLREKI
jgi:hypothetical protein